MSRVALRSSSSNPPPATRPPRPDLPFHLVRALALICIVLALVQPLALPQVAASPSLRTMTLPRVLHEPGVVAPALLRRAFEPPLFPLISAVALASLGIVAGELVVALIAAILARHAARRATRSTICLRVRQIGRASCRERVCSWV